MGCTDSKLNSVSSVGDNQNPSFTASALEQTEQPSFPYFHDAANFPAAELTAPSDAFPIQTVTTATRNNKYYSHKYYNNTPKHALYTPSTQQSSKYETIYFAAGGGPNNLKTRLQARFPQLKYKTGLMCVAASAYIEPTLDQVLASGTNYEIVVQCAVPTYNDDKELLLELLRYFVQIQDASVVFCRTARQEQLAKSVVKEAAIRSGAHPTSKLGNIRIVIEHKEFLPRRIPQTIRSGNGKQERQPRHMNIVKKTQKNDTAEVQSSVQQQQHQPSMMQPVQPFAQKENQQQQAFYSRLSRCQTSPQSIQKLQEHFHNNHNTTRLQQQIDPTSFRQQPAMTSQYSRLSPFQRNPQLLHQQQQQQQHSTIHAQHQHPQPIRDSTATTNVYYNRLSPLQRNPHPNLQYALQANNSTVPSFPPQSHVPADEAYARLSVAQQRPPPKNVPDAFQHKRLPTANIKTPFVPTQLNSAVTFLWPSLEALQSPREQHKMHQTKIELATIPTINDDVCATNPQSIQTNGMVSLDNSDASGRHSQDQVMKTSISFDSSSTQANPQPLPSPDTVAYGYNNDAASQERLPVLVAETPRRLSYEMNVLLKYQKHAGFGLAYDDHKAAIARRFTSSESSNSMDLPKSPATETSSMNSGERKTLRPGKKRPKMNDVHYEKEVGLPATSAKESHYSTTKLSNISLNGTPTLLKSEQDPRSVYVQKRVSFVNATRNNTQAEKEHSKRQDGIRGSYTNNDSATPSSSSDRAYGYNDDDSIKNVKILKAREAPNKLSHEMQALQEHQDLAGLGLAYDDHKAEIAQKYFSNPSTVSFDWPQLPVPVNQTEISGSPQTLRRKKNKTKIGNVSAGNKNEATAITSAWHPIIDGDRALPVAVVDKISRDTTAESSNCGSPNSNDASRYRKLRSYFRLSTGKNVVIGQRS
jgi:hypothetical protein